MGISAVIKEEYPKLHIFIFKTLVLKVFYLSV